jgi:DMSO/TMAO reductase YedYZ molybdopterin-dependent catalytic subunit
LASGSKSPPGRKKALEVVAIVVIVAIAGTVVGLISWRVFPFSARPQNTSSVNLPAMNLTLVALNGTELVLNQKNIGNLPSFESKGGFKTSVGQLQEIGNYTGVPISELLALVGGMNSSCSLNVTGSDGYSMVFTYNQVQGENFTCYNPATGDEVQSVQPLTMILAYYQNGVNLGSDKGPLRLAIVGPEGLLTDGHYWVKWVTKVEITPCIVDWTLVLVGPNPDNMTREAFESGANPNCHGANWTDANNNVWSGMPLWYLIGWIDDNDRMEFNDTLALQGYKVKVMDSHGDCILFNSTTVMRNNNIIVANRLNGAPLPDPYWPLRLVGPGVSSDQMLGNIVEIQMILPEGS